MIPFGKYLLLDRIAVGGMAEVYTAKSFGVEGFEKILAIKRILPTMAEDEDFIQMFIDEAKIAGQLTHANIAPIYELGKIGDSHYIAMEYVWGKDLLQIMNRFRKMRKQMPPTMGAWIGAKICEGLDFAHRKKDRSGRPLGIIHRDVSPQNCLVSYEGQVKMIDFGIAKAASRNTKTQAGVLKGKFGYMSPEQVRGLPIDHRSDIFAVGTCLYEMLTTERLFVGESDFSTLEKVRNAQVAPLSAQIPDIPRELEQIVMKALARDVENRWQSAAEMQEALQRFIARERPPFGTSKLAAWMRTAFAPEMSKEKQRLDSFARIGPPATPPAPPAREEEEELPELAGEATVMSASPFDDDGGGPSPDDFQEEATQIFFSAEEMMEDMGSSAAVPAAGRPPAVAQVPARPVGLPPPRGPMQRGPTQPAPMQRGPMAAPPSPVVAQRSMAVGLPAPHSAQPAPMPHAPMQPAPFAPMGQGIPSQGMPPGQAPSAGMAQPGMGGAFAPAPPLQSPAMVSGGFAAMPPGAQPPVGPLPIDPSPMGPSPIGERPSHVARRTDTVELQAPSANARPAGSRSKLIVAALAATFFVVLVGALGSYFAFFRGPGEGTVEIRVVPTEAMTAEIALDGQTRGSAPLRIEGVAAGAHQLRITHPGFEPLTREIVVTENGTISLDIALQSASPIALAQPALAAPSAAEAAVGTLVPTAPAVAAATPVEPQAEAQVEAQVEPQVEPQEPPRAEPVAEAPSPEPVAVATAAPAAEPEAPPSRPAAEPAARPTPPRATTTPRPTGTSRGGSSERTAPTPRPTPVRTPTPAASSTPARGGQGTLNINALPWARVFIDGRDTGRNTPVRGLRVSAGTHRLGLRTADGRMVEETIQVPANETINVVRRL